MVSEGDLGGPDGSWELAVIERMIAALVAGRISEAEFVEWVWLRLRVAEALGDGATA